MSTAAYKSAHEPKSYGQQWKEDVSGAGLKKSFESIIPTGTDLKAQGVLIYKVASTGCFKAGKFIFTKHD